MRQVVGGGGLVVGGCSVTCDWDCVSTVYGFQRSWHHPLNWPTVGGGGALWANYLCLPIIKILHTGDTGSLGVCE